MEISPLFRTLRDNRLGHWCPACNAIHAIAVGEGAPPRWEFNGDKMVAPTFEPSVRHNTGPLQEGGPDRICHYFLRNGQLEFCSDSTHALAGQTVPLPPLPQQWRDA